MQEDLYLTSLFYYFQVEKRPKICIEIIFSNKCILAYMMTMYLFSTLNFVRKETNVYHRKLSRLLIGFK